jgi:hypothetical protein
VSFVPVVPFGGVGGWNFLERTRARQEEAFQNSPVLARRTADFAERIGQVKSAEELVGDRRLLEVALGAFGLDEDIRNRFFIRKVLEEGTTAPRALANRLSDKRYLALAETFGFGDRPGGNVGRAGFAADVITRYRQRQFEAAIGQANPDMRLALGMSREIGDIADRRLSNNAMWFTAMASPPVRAVFERALRLPSQVGALDIDRQLTLFKERAEARLGTADFRDFATAQGQERLRQAFLTPRPAPAGPCQVPPRVPCPRRIIRASAGGVAHPLRARRCLHRSCPRCRGGQGASGDSGGPGSVGGGTRRDLSRNGIPAHREEPALEARDTA